MKIFFFKKEEGENEWIVVFLACFFEGWKIFLCAGLLAQYHTSTTQGVFVQGVNIRDV